MSMQTFKELFNKAQNNKEGVFIPFIVTGDPDYETSLEIAKTLVDNGADALEIGFPFSDPVADEPSIQDADIRAFDAGMTIEKSFKFLEELRKYTNKPFGLLLYYNIVYKHGVDAFYKRLADIGVNAVLIADLPPEEADEALLAANKYGVEQIFIVAQTTSNERLAYIADIVGGFICVTSVMSTTGVHSKVETSSKDLIKRVREHTDLPLCVEYGISKPEHIHKVLNSGANGAIVKSALVNIIADNLENKDKMFSEIIDYVDMMKKATRKNC